ncbi:MAG: hypothetical protein NTY73_03050 [Candidatus Micrarchaeota archaeon]|nr:hypothetical protein [Candidatus Micrarchaeota archaeon]
MKKGFILTAIATVLFVLLIDAAFQYSRSSSAYSQRVSEMIVSEKVGYIFDDITEDVTNITGINLTQQQSDLVLVDALPATNITSNLALYEDFVRSRYLSAELEATFLTPDEQQTNLTNLTSQIIVQPFGMTYNYTNFSKNDLFIQIPYAQSAAINKVYYNISVNGSNFTDFAGITWNPSPQPCSIGTIGCIHFYLEVDDGLNQKYTSAETLVDLNKTAGYLNISFVNQSCSIEMWMGNKSGQSYLLDMGIHGCQVKSVIDFNFNSSNFWLYYPMKLKVRDLNYNTSKEDNIDLIMTRLIK